MKPQPLRFLHLVKVFEFNKISLVQSPPAPAGSPYFIGSSKAEAFFPYSSGPVQYLDRDYADEELVPVRLIHSLVKHLKMDRERFWMDAAALQFEGNKQPSEVRARARN